VDSAECRQQTAPCVEAMLEDLLAVLIGCLSKLSLKSGDGVVLVVAKTGYCFGLLRYLRPLTPDACLPPFR